MDIYKEFNKVKKGRVPFCNPGVVQGRRKCASDPRPYFLLRDREAQRDHSGRENDLQVDRPDPTPARNPAHQEGTPARTRKPGNTGEQEHPPRLTPGIHRSRIRKGRAFEARPFLIDRRERRTGCVRGSGPSSTLEPGMPEPVPQSPSHGTGAVGYGSVRLFLMVTSTGHEVRAAVDIRNLL